MEHIEIGNRGQNNPDSRFYRHVYNLLSWNAADRARLDVKNLAGGLFDYFFPTRCVTISLYWLM
jgi:hypothetical protein